MPLYFAYGSNMDAVVMRARCPKSRLLGGARLARHRFALMSEGYATVVRDPGRDVHGLLYDLALSDVPALDRYEEVGRGLYAKVVQPVLRGDGAPTRALIYVGRAASGPAKPKPGYLENVIEAARAAELPAAYVDFLRGLLSGGAPIAAPQRRAIKWTPNEG